jgi:hypothetical protein
MVWDRTGRIIRFVVWVSEFSAHIQTSNRLRCQQIDGAMLASAVMIQPENQRSLDELQFTYYGAYAVMSPNVKIVEKAIPNLGTAVQPALQDLTQQLQLNTDTVSTYGAESEFTIQESDANFC